jgi:hypothetical protein
MNQKLKNTLGLMMTKESRLPKSLAVLSATFLAGATVLAQTIVFDNTDPANYLDSFHTPGNGVEFGDEVNLAGIERIVTNFSFEYFGAGLSGNETGELFFRMLDGPVIGEGLAARPSPGTILYSSGEFSISSGFQTVNVTGIAIPVPDTFVWSVRFDGLNGAEQAGLLFYDPPTVGSSFDDFWQITQFGWETFIANDGAIPGNFSARIQAVPEPSTYVFALLAGLGWLGFAGYRRRSA